MQLIIFVQIFFFMSAKSSAIINWDTLGIGASLFCAIHCLLLPIVLSTLPLLGVELLENMVVEIAVLLISMLAGVFALYFGYKRQHNKFWPILVFGLGMTAMITGNMHFQQWNAAESILKSVGVLCIVTAHIANWRYRKTFGRHHCNNASH